MGDCVYDNMLISEDPHEIIQAAAPHAQIAGNYDYEEGGIVNPQDAAYIAAASPDVVLALITKIEVLECALKDADTHIAEQALLHGHVQSLRDALEEMTECGAEAWSEDRPCVRIAREVLEETK